MFYLCVACTRNEVRTYEPHSLDQELPRFQERNMFRKCRTTHLITSPQRRSMC